MCNWKLILISVKLNSDSVCVCLTWKLSCSLWNWILILFLCNSKACERGRSEKVLGGGDLSESERKGVLRRVRAHGCEQDWEFPWNFCSEADLRVDSGECSGQFAVFLLPPPWNSVQAVSRHLRPVSLLRWRRRVISLTTRRVFCRLVVGFGDIVGIERVLRGIHVVSLEQIPWKVIASNGYREYSFYPVLDAFPFLACFYLESKFCN